VIRRALLANGIWTACVAGLVSFLHPVDSTAQPRPYPSPVYNHSTAMRLQVTPHETEVYVDGYYAGIADDFDGVFQRLRIGPGEHEIELYLDGYRTFRQKAELRPGVTFRLRHEMQRLEPGDSPEPRPKPAEGQRMGGPQPGDRPEGGGYGRGVPPRGQRGRPPAARREQPAEVGTLSLRVQPPDASVWIDGERWETVEGDERFIVDLPEGPHRVEVRKDGYRSYSATITVRRGETVRTNISLPPQ
jgi:PEGA domain-containing protein